MLVGGSEKAANFSLLEGVVVHRDSYIGIITDLKISCSQNVPEMTAFFLVLAGMVALITIIRAFCRFATDMLWVHGSFRFF